MDIKVRPRHGSSLSSQLLNIFLELLVNSTSTERNMKYKYWKGEKHWFASEVTRIISLMGSGFWKPNSPYFLLFAWFISPLGQWATSLLSASSREGRKREMYWKERQEELERAQKYYCTHSRTQTHMHTQDTNLEKRITGHIPWW